jgi:hypothetical protein
MRARVDLPDPEGPHSATCSPGRTSRLTRESTSIRPRPCPPYPRLTAAALSTSPHPLLDAGVQDAPDASVILRVQRRHLRPTLGAHRVQPAAKTQWPGRRGARRCGR